MKLQRRQVLQALSLLSGSAWLSSQQRPVQAQPGVPLAALSPKPVQRGDRLVAVAPGTWVDPDTLSGENGWSSLYQRWGLDLVIPSQALGQSDYFSAPDLERSQLLSQAWRDPAASGVVCIGGGWGAARVLEAGFKFDASPRWCVGFSDNCALLLAQLAAGSLGGIHGWKDERVRQLLMGEPVEPLKGQPLRAGIAEGPLVITNLTVGTHLIGTPWMPSLDGAILVLEDTGEAPYRVDRMLTHWRTAGLLQNLAGVGIGRFSWRPDDVLPGDLTLAEVLEERLGDLGVPVLAELPVGHGRPNKALPMGRRARLDADSGSLALIS